MSLVGEERVKTRKYQMLSESPAFFAAGRVFLARRLLYKNQLYSTTHAPAAAPDEDTIVEGRDRKGGRVPMGILNGETRLLFCLPPEWSKAENWEGRPKLNKTLMFTYGNAATCNSNCKRRCDAAHCRVTDASSVSLSPSLCRSLGGSTM